MKRIAKEIITTELCSYGCGNQAKFVNGSNKLMCCERHNKCPALRIKNSSGLKVAHKDGRAVGWNSLRESYGVNTTWSTGLTAFNDDRIKSHYDPTTTFTMNGIGPHKKILISERGHKCECCGLSEWLNKPITIELEHIDGNNQNNTKSNLKLLCPNCHSQTDTWRGRGKNTGRKTISDDELFDALIESEFNIHKALKRCSMTPKGANYERCYNLLIRLNAGMAKLAETHQT